MIFLVTSQYHFVGSLLGKKEAFASLLFTDIISHLYQAHAISILLPSDNSKRGAYRYLPVPRAGSFAGNINGESTEFMIN